MLCKPVYYDSNEKSDKGWKIHLPAVKIDYCHLSSLQIKLEHNETNDKLPTVSGIMLLNVYNNPLFL